MPLQPYSIMVVTAGIGYESKLTLPLTTGHGMSALRMRQAVWLRGVSSQATFCIEDAKYFTLWYGVLFGTGSSKE